MGKFIIFAGIVIVLAGIIVLLLEKFGGRTGAPLPGDILVRRGNFTFYFPIVTSIVISLVLTLVLWLVSALKR